MANPLKSIEMGVDRLSQVISAARTLTATAVLVGVPDQKTDRKDDAGITNAALAYIHTNGSPEANIPARPFLEPGVARKQQEIVDRLRDTAAAVYDGNGGVVERGLAAAGQIAASSAQAVIREGISPPLAQSTVDQRRAKYGRKAASSDQTTPLIDTAQLVRSITFVLRKT